jgi:hypothetical protein
LPCGHGKRGQHGVWDVPQDELRERRLEPKYIVHEHGVQLCVLARRPAWKLRSLERLLERGNSLGVVPQ